MAQIDSSIYLQQQSPDFLGSFQQGMNLRQMADQRSREKEQYAKQKSIDDAYKAGVVQGEDGSFSQDRGLTLSSLSKADPRAAMEQQSKWKADDIATRKNQMEEQLKKLELTGQLLGASVDQNSYTNSLMEAKKYGIDTSGLPDQFDPRLVSTLRARSLSAKEQIDNELKKQNYDILQKQNLFDNNVKIQQLGIQKAKADEDSKNLPQNVYQAATYGKRVEDANNQITSLLSKGYDPTSTTQNLINKISPEMFKGEDAKLMEQAQRNFVNAVLRRESGSAISPAEFDSANKQYFPQIGDTKEVLAQKERNREVALGGLKNEGSKAWNRLENKIEASKPNQSKEQTKVVKGQLYRKVEGGWLPAQK